MLSMKELMKELERLEEISKNDSKVIIRQSAIGKIEAIKELIQRRLGCLGITSEISKRDKMLLTLK